MDKPCYFHSDEAYRECSKPGCDMTNGPWETCYWGNEAVGRVEEKDKAKLAQARKIREEIWEYIGFAFYGLVEPSLPQVKAQLTKIIKKNL